MDRLLGNFIPGSSVLCGLFALFVSVRIATQRIAMQRQKNFLIHLLVTASLYFLFSSPSMKQWCSPRDQGLGLKVLVLDHEVLVLNIWSWSRRKSLAVFFLKIFVVILDGSEQGTPWHFVRDSKSSLPFESHCLREPSALHAYQPQLRGYLTMWAIC